jgi:chemotaxis response regulator CheB
VFVVLHLPATGTSALPDILSRHGPLAATHAKDGEPIKTGRIYVAPPDHHLLLRTGHVHLTRGPRENSHRPAVDTLFGSAAREYATRVIGVVLSGALDDGTEGWRPSRPAVASRSFRMRRTRSTLGCQAVRSSTSRSTMSLPSRPWRSCWLD